MRSLAKLRIVRLVGGLAGVTAFVSAWLAWHQGQPALYATAVGMTLAMVAMIMTGRQIK